jgi:hypothetical protein
MIAPTLHHAPALHHALTLHHDGASHHATVAITALVIAGWTGRDAAKVAEHIEELAAIGVKPPANVPVFYRVAAARLTTARAIEVIGTDSSGEVEFVIFNHQDRLWVTVGSDHTDRAVEAYGITVAKQMCEKVIAAEAWPLADVAGHWDRLILRAHADGTLYQEGSVAEMRAPNDLIAAYGGLPRGAAMFGGTMPVQGGLRHAARFAMELEDPVLGRVLTHDYEVISLPVAG